MSERNMEYVNKKNSRSINKTENTNSNIEKLSNIGDINQVEALNNISNMVSVEEFKHHNQQN